MAHATAARLFLASSIRYRQQGRHKLAALAMDIAMLQLHMALGLHVGGRSAVEAAGGHHHGEKNHG